MLGDGKCHILQFLNDKMFSYKTPDQTEWDADLDLSGDDGAGIPIVKSNKKLM